MNPQIVEELMTHFGRTGAKKRPRIRKFHAELLVRKYHNDERVLSSSELNRPKEYVDRMVKYSEGFLNYINEEEVEIEITDKFREQMKKWHRQYSPQDELDEEEEESWSEQGIIVEDDSITFNGKLIYSKFRKLVSDEQESINDPRLWEFNDKDIHSYDHINFSDKNSAPFTSHLFLLKFYVLRKIDEVAFVTSRFVHCPKCKANYVIAASKIEFQTTYKCENIVGDKQCKTSLKKFPARKMIPTYIYEISVEVKSKEGTEFKEFFLESFTELNPGFFTGMLFGRTESKSNSFYFLCLTAKEEKSKMPFQLEIESNHAFFGVVDSVIKHIQKIGFVIDPERARLVYYIETLKKLMLIINKEINVDHSLYFGAPGIGKTEACKLLSHVFYPNSGFVSGPRFSLPGLTGGQKEIFYQDTSKKKNVPGLFSNPAFVFDEINNDHFLKDDKAVNLFKSSALASSGTSSVVGGKEFRRISLVAGTANYITDHLRHYQNKIKKIYNRELKKEVVTEQSSFIDQLTTTVEKEIPESFDFYCPIKDYGLETPKELKNAVLKVRDEGNNYLTNFPKPLMERFYWTVTVHPKHDREFLTKKKIDVLSHLTSRHSLYSKRELISQLFVSNFNSLIRERTAETRELFKNPNIEKAWSEQVKEFLELLGAKYPEFFSMFHRISQVHVFALYTLSLINQETHLSFSTKRVFERLVSLLHTPIKLEDFHNADFINFRYLGESRGEMLELIRRYNKQDISHLVDFERKLVRTTLVSLENTNKITKISEFIYEIVEDTKPEVLKNVDNN